MRNAMKNRLARLEAYYGRQDEPEPTLFIEVVDASVLELGEPSSSVTWGDETLVGYGGTGPRSVKVSRFPGEALEALKARAASLHPGQRVFMPVYAHDLAAGPTDGLLQ
jgi:hypothetical protein